MLTGQIKVNDNTIVSWEIENVLQLDGQLYEYEYEVFETATNGARRRASGILYHRRDEGAIALVKAMFDDAIYRRVY